MIFLVDLVWFILDPPKRKKAQELAADTDVLVGSGGGTGGRISITARAGPVAMRKSELPGTESIQVEAGRPLRPYKGLDEIIQKGLLVFKCHDSETLDSRVTTPPNVS